MGVGNRPSKVSDLSFQVFNRPLHPDWFAVKEHRRVAVEGWEADVRIIEGGHVVVFHCGPVRLSEVLCGPDTELPEAGVLFQSGVRHERSTSLKPSPRVEYQTSFEVERLDPEVFAHLTEEMTLDPSQGRLIFRFPPANRLSPAPVSLLKFMPRTRGLNIHTFHTFPDECAIVRTCSLFEPMTAAPGTR